MPVLVPGIHALPIGDIPEKDVDGRNESGHDAERLFGPITF